MRNYQQIQYRFTKVVFLAERLDQKFQKSLGEPFFDGAKAIWIMNCP